MLLIKKVTKKPNAAITSALGFCFYIQLVRPKAVAIAVSVVRMMFTITLHLLFFSFVIMVRDFLSEITVQSEDCT